MSAPLARGLIIAASVLVAAGIAIMENEQVRRWLDEHRRRIAIALYSLGDGINPSFCDGLEDEAQQAEMEQINRQRRHDIVRRNREELLRRAREDGTSVDLDELTALGMLERETEEDLRRSHGSMAAAGVKSPTNTDFGDFIGEDGKLRVQPYSDTAARSNATLATALSSADESGLRHRGTGARGYATGSAFAPNPFGDEMALHDDDAEELTADAIQHSATLDSQSTVESESPLTIISPRPIHVEPTIRNIPIVQPDTTTEQVPVQYKTEDEFNAEIEEAIRRSLQTDTVSAQLIDVSSPARTETMQIERSQASTPNSLPDSLFEPSSPRSGYASAVESLPTTRAMSQTLSPAPVVPYASLAGSYHSINPDDVHTIDAYMYDGERTPMGSGTLTPTDDDAFSTVSATEARSEGGEIDHSADARSEAGTNDSYSVVGASTPGTWSEVGSDDGMSEAGDGRIQQPQPQR